MFKKSAEKYVFQKSGNADKGKRTKSHYWTKWRKALEYADHIPSPAEKLRKNLHRVSRVLLADKIHVRVKGEDRHVHLACDTEIGVIDYLTFKHEDESTYSALLGRIEETGYRPIICVGKMNEPLQSCLQARKIPYQTCIISLLAKLRNIIRENPRRVNFPEDFKELYQMMKNIFIAANHKELLICLNKLREVLPAFSSDKHQKILAWFWQNLETATTRLKFKKNIPISIEMLENASSAVQTRITKFRGIKSEQSLDKVLKIFFHLESTGFSGSK